MAYKEGEIDYTTFTQLVKEAVQSELEAQNALINYLESAFHYNISINNIMKKQHINTSQSFLQHFLWCLVAIKRPIRKMEFSR